MWSMGACGFEQCEYAEPAIEVRNLCFKIPRKWHGVSLLGYAANAQHCMLVGLGQPAEVPIQTTDKFEKALMTLQDIARFACDQHDQCQLCKSVDADGQRRRACLGL